MKTRNAVKSWTVLPPSLPPRGPVPALARFLAIVFGTSVLGFGVGSIASSSPTNAGGELKMFGRNYPSPTHREVWPKVKLEETIDEKMERLGLTMLEPKPTTTSPEIPLTATGVVEPTKVDPVLLVKTQKVKQTSKRNEKPQDHPTSTATKSIIVDIPQQTESEVEVPQPVTESLLSKIRKSPSRIYLDQSFTLGELTWTFRNATDEGVEFLVTNRSEATRTYYMPRIVADGQESIMEGSVVAPGQTVFGVFPAEKLKQRKELRLTLQAAGTAEKKVKVNLPW